MQKQLLLTLILFALLGFGKVWCQESLQQEAAEIHKKYWGNLEFKRADSLQHAGKIAEARILYQKVSEQFQEEQNWVPFIEATRVHAATYEGNEDYQTGVAVLEQALIILETDAQVDLSDRYILYRQLGKLYLSARERELALSPLLNQLEILKTRHQQDFNWDFVEVWTGLTTIYMTTNHLEKAFEYALQAKAVVEALNHSHYTLSKEVYSQLGWLYAQKFNDKIKSNEMYEKGLDLALSHSEGKDEDVRNFYQDLGYNYRSVGAFDQSLVYFEKALSLVKKEKLDYKHHSTYTFLAGIYKLLGSYDQAIAYYNQAIELIKLNPSDLSNRISAHNGLSSVYTLKKEFETALQHVQQADSLLQIFAKQAQNQYLLFHNHRGVHWHYARLWHLSGELEKARKHYGIIVEQYSNEQTEWYDLGILQDLSLIFEIQNKMDSAFLYNQKALIASCKTFNSPDYQQLPSAQDLRSDIRIYWILQDKIRFTTKMAMNEKHLDRQENLCSNTLQVLDLADQFHVLNQKKLNLFRGRENHVQLKASIENYQLGLSVAHDFNQLNKNAKTLAKAFYYTQKMKAQQLWLALLDSDATKFENLPANLLETERDLLVEIQKYEEKVLEAQENHDSIALDLYKNKYLFESQRAYDALIRKMEVNYPDYYEAKYNFVPETSETLQNVLTEKELLIEYVFADSALFIFTLAPDQSLQLQKVPLDTLSTDRIDAFNKRLQSSSWMRRSSREQFINLSYALYQQFLQPIENQLAGKDRLIIIGDGMTNYIPFEALLSSDMVKPFHELDYLIKKHEVSYHYSASLFAKARKKVVPKTSGIYAFAPVYEKVDQSITVAENNTSNTPENTFRAFDKDGHYAPLPESEREVNEIMALFERTGSTDGKLALREAAHEMALKTNLEKPYRFIHIAGHSFADLDNPKFSGIACFEETGSVPDSIALTEDGILYTGEIYNLSTQADLVTLSSCESGYGKMEVSEGLLGLNRAFIYAGTPNVVFSLWKVYDKVSAELMVDFYEQVLSGKSYSASLRRAKLNLLKQEATAAPHYWGPYLLIGQ